MKLLAFLFLLAGIYMLFNGELRMTNERVVADYGSAVINKSTTRQIAWPWYSGPVAIITGIALYAAAKRKD